MAFESGTAYPESDADDEYERSLHDSSPVLATDSEASPTNSDVSSNEHTPTTYGRQLGEDQLPETIITEWTADECGDFVGSLGLRQYTDQFLENEIVGEALVALLHDDLKQMGIASVGHRLTILKSVYDIKIKQDIPIESDHYVPLSADAEAQYATATLKDIRHLVDQLRLRDERMSIAELELRRITEEYRRLREDLLPVFKMAKETQPLPYHPSTTNNQTYPQQASSFNYNNTLDTISPPVPTPLTAQPSSGLNRKFSTKKLFLGSTPKNASPTHNLPERSMMEQTLDPTSAAERAVLSSSHLAALNNGNSALSPGHSPNIPSPTSPPNNSTFSTASTLASRSYNSSLTTPSGRSTFTGSDVQDNYNGYSNSSSTLTSSTRESMKPPPSIAPARRTGTPAAVDTSSNSASNASAASVEIFKSFRVSMEDPCYKVLPAALKKYNINAPWNQYALYIVYGDQERCLELNEKPLILFKQLDKEGKRPMFMLRKTTPGGVGGDVPGGDLSGMNSAGVGMGPGGVHVPLRGGTPALGGGGGGYAVDPPGGII